ncbi:MAG: LPS assembly protein LptD [Syntrophobacteraceae bacterium]
MRIIPDLFLPGGQLRAGSPGSHAAPAGIRLHRFVPLALIYCMCMVFLFSTPLTAAAQLAGSGSSPFLIDRKDKLEALASSWQIEAEKLSHDQERQIYEAEGNVRISSKTRLIEADRAAVDMINRKAELWGNVSLQYDKNWLKGDHVIWDLDAETGWLDNGVIFFSENNFFVQGYSIAKTGPKQFELKEGFVTSCDPSEPDWRFQYQHMTVDVGGTAWARQVSMWARDVPVGYLPIIGIPVNTERQSGFLLPWAGYADLTGFDFEIPYYWAFRDDMDATFYARYLEKRGFMAGAEFRINNRQWGEGIWAVNYIHDVADKNFLLGEGYPFQAEDRFWLRGRHNVELPWKIEAKLDIDFVSDRSFLQEFKSGSVSTVQSNAIFKDYFGRGLLHDANSAVRESTMYLERRWESALVSMDTRYFQQLRDDLDQFTVQTLPEISFMVTPTTVLNTPLYYTLDSSFVNYWREQRDREQRLDIHPRLFYPLHLGKYLDIEPSAGFRSTSFLVDWDNKSFDSFSQRGISEASVELSSRLNRVYPVNWGKIVALQHAIRPEVSYEYATQTVSGPTPLIDRLDRDQSRNGVRYGFSTFLTSKQMGTDQQGQPSPTYREWARLRVFQFFNVEKPVLDDPLFSSQILDEGPSPVGMRLDLNPSQHVRFSYDADFDLLNTGQGNIHDVYMTLDSGKGHMFRVDYQVRPDLSVNEVTTELFVQTLPGLYLNTYHDLAIDEGFLFKQGYGIRYYRGCWGIGVAYERENDDNRFVLSLDLLGIGTFGSRMQYLGRPTYETNPEFQRPEMYKLAR